MHFFIFCQIKKWDVYHDPELPLFDEIDEMGATAPHSKFLEMFFFFKQTCVYRKVNI